jgi:Transglutaminase-like superfamily
MKTIKKFFYRMGGADYNVIKDCSASTKWTYLRLGGATIVATILGIIGGFDIAHQFTPNLYFNGAVGILWRALTFWYDFSLINSPRVVGNSKYLRVIGGIASVGLTMSALLVLMNQARIDSRLLLDNSAEVKSLDDDYLKAKEGRYQAVISKKAEAEKYNSDEVIPEARRGHPGPHYNEKKAAYDVMIGAVNSETSKLDTAEEQYHNVYQTKRNALLAVTTNDFFSKVFMLPTVLQSAGWTSLVIAGLFFIFLTSLDLGAISMKLSMPHDDEYHRDEQAYADLMRNARNAGAEAREEVERRRVLLTYVDERRELDEQEYAVSMRGVEDLIVREALLRRTIAVLRERGYESSVEKLEKTLADFASGTTDSDNDKNNNTSYVPFSPEDVLRLTSHMRETLKEVKAEAPPEELTRKVFDWIVDNIKYDEDHGKFFCRTARETYNDGHGLCSELAALYIAFLRASGIEANFAAVDVDHEGVEVKHACALVKNGGLSFLSDPAYRLFQVEHKTFEEWSDEMSQFRRWNI